MEIWADEHPEIQFSVMHPGWVDTPAARRGLGEFFEKMKDKFRSPEEGADTVVWLAISKEALKARNGTYFQGKYYCFNGIRFILLKLLIVAYLKHGVV